MQKQDIQNILAFLNRVDLKGNEALELVRLQKLLVDLFENKTETNEKPS